MTLRKQGGPILALQDKPYNSKSDVWALGCVLYELCSLRRPFTGQSVSAIAVKILRSGRSGLQAHSGAEQITNRLMVGMKVRATNEPLLLCMAVHGCAWLCMAVHGCAWLCMAVHGCAAL
jgi:serine/threonine protein kinase